MMRFFFGVLAYLVPPFALGFVWHLIAFEHYYAALAIYRSDIIIPFGFLSMLIQATVFAWVYERTFAQRNGALLSRGLTYGALNQERYSHGASPRSLSQRRTSWHRFPTIS